MQFSLNKFFDIQEVLYFKFITIIFVFRYFTASMSADCILVHKNVVEKTGSLA